MDGNTDTMKSFFAPFLDIADSKLNLPARAPDKFNPFKPYLKTIQILADSLWLKNAKI